MVSLQYNQEIILIGKAVLIAILGVFIAFIVKYLVRTSIDKGILKKLFKEAHMYETSSLINKIFTEALQWIIIIGFFNYSLTLLNFNFLSDALVYVIANVPKISIFLFIIVAGIFLSKLITSRINEQDIENKNEIIALTELVIIAGAILTSFEFIGITATALVELYKVILYVIGVVIVLLIINPKFFEKSKQTKKKKSTVKMFFS